MSERATSRVVLSRDGRGGGTITLDCRDSWSRADAEACHETDRMGADSPYMVDKLQRVLSLGLLGEAFSRAGLWARQWVVGRYAVAVVRLDPEVMGSVRKIRAEVEGARDDK